jgi:hypothetical protein
VASAVSLVLIAFGTALGLGIVSSSPTWRDTSPTLTVVSGLYLLLVALVSFGVGGYVAGRLRERWDPSAHSDVVEFRDGTHGIVAWALAVVITGAVAAASVASLSSKAAPPATSSATTAGEPLIAYELDRLFRGDRRAVEGDITYARAEAGRILLAATGRQGITPDDRAYLARLVAARTGLAQPDAERRVEEAITAASTAGAKGPAERRDPWLCHRRISTGRGRGCVVRGVRRWATSGQRRSTTNMALASACPIPPVHAQCWVKLDY